MKTLFLEGLLSGGWGETAKGVSEPSPGLSEPKPSTHREQHAAQEAHHTCTRCPGLPPPCSLGAV